MGKIKSVFRKSKKYYSQIYYGALIVLAAVIVIAFFNLQQGLSLWLDEMFQVDYCRESSSLLNIICIDPYTPPLFNIIAWVWYRLVPFGEVWLHIPSLCFVIISLFLIAAIGRRLHGRMLGFLAAMLFVVNAKVFSECIFSFRAYSLLLVLSCLFLYLYIRRIQTPANEISWKLSAAMAITTLALGYTHYFGVLFACMFFIIDLYLLARGRLNGARLKVFAPYCFALVCYLPWLKIAFATLAKAKTNTLAHSWQNAMSGGAPNFHSFLYWLSGEVAEVLMLFNIACVTCIIVNIWRIYKHKYEWQKDLPMIAMVFVILLMLGGMWVYCSFINTYSMMWVSRYFIPLIPCIVLVTTLGFYDVLRHLPVPNFLQLVCAVMVVALLIPSCVATIHNDLLETSSTRFYKNLTQWLEGKDDIEKDTTLVMAVINTTDKGRQIQAWKHYYFNRKDTRDFDVNILDALDSEARDNPTYLLYYKKIYVTCQHFDPDIPQEYKSVLSKNFTKKKTENPGGGKTYVYIRKK